MYLPARVISEPCSFDLLFSMGILSDSCHVLFYHFVAATCGSNRGRKENRLAIRALGLCVLLIIGLTHHD